MITVLIVFLNIAGLLLLYLTLPNQRWLSQPLSAWFYRDTSIILLIFSAMLWIENMSPAAGLFTSVVLAMALLPVFSLLSLIWRPERHR